MERSPRILIKPPYLLLALLALRITQVVAFSTTTSPSTSKSGTVSVTVERTLSGVSPSEAKDAWTSYTFEKGGGIPALVSCEGNSRLLMPLMARETLLPENDEEGDERKDSVRYKLTELGPIWQSEIVADSHLGQVTFEPTDGDESAVLMRWTTSFETKNRKRFWEAVTQSMVQLASENLVSYLATPRLYTKPTYLSGTTPQKALDAWLEFTIKGGGGLPLNPPFVLPSNENVVDILRVPPFLRESVLSVSRSDDDDACEAIYKVMNPGVLTCFPVHSHTGRVRFLPINGDDNDRVEMLWEAEIRPMRGWNFLTETFTDSIISTMSRNLKVHLAESGASVSLYRPRGGGDAWAQVPKDSWLGGVLQAHLSDGRSTWEQTISIFQPWTWGRNPEWDEEGETARWESAAMSE